MERPLTATRGVGGVLLVLSLPACSGSEARLLVDVRSDYLPGVEVSRAETVLFPDRISRRDITASDDLFTGTRVAEFGSLEPGEHTFEVSLHSASGAIVARRRVVGEVRGPTGYTISMTRACGDRGACPGPGDDAGWTECRGGVCVDPRCFEETVELCTPGPCTADGDCAVSVPCVAAECESGVCYVRPSDARCHAGERCDPAAGCVVEARDGGVRPERDAGPAGPRCTLTVYRGGVPTTTADPGDTLVIELESIGAPAHGCRFFWDGVLVEPADRACAGAVPVDVIPDEGIGPGLHAGWVDLPGTATERDCSLSLFVTDRPYCWLSVVPARSRWSEAVTVTADAWGDDCGEPAGLCCTLRVDAPGEVGLVYPPDPRGCVGSAAGSGETFFGPTRGPGLYRLRLEVRGDGGRNECAFDWRIDP